MNKKVAGTGTCYVDCRVFIIRSESTTGRIMHP